MAHYDLRQRDNIDAVAKAWVDRCLIADGSLLSPDDHQLWSTDNLSRAYHNVADAPLLDPRSFLEEFLDFQWGTQSGRTFNKALSVLHDFFRHHQLRGNIQGDPTLAIERAKKRDVHRETIPPEDRAKLLAANDDLRDRVALTLLLDYGIRKGSLQGIQYGHSDHRGDA